MSEVSAGTGAGGRAEDGVVARLLARAGARLLAGPPALWALVTAGWALFVRRLSERPAGDLPPPILHGWLNNLAHAPLFGLLALWAWLALPRRGGRPPTGRAAVAGLLVFVTGYGVLDECLQARVPGREASALDVVTDLVGASAVLAVGLAVLGEKDRERTLRRRLALGLIASLCSAALATFVPGA